MTDRQPSGRRPGSTHSMHVSTHSMRIALVALVGLVAAGTVGCGNLDRVDSSEYEDNRSEWFTDEDDQASGFGRDRDQNRAPTITGFPEQPRVYGGSETDPISFQVSDAEMASGRLDVSASSEDRTLIPEVRVTNEGADRQRQLYLTAVSKATGSATIEIAASDGIVTDRTTFEVQIIQPKTSVSAGECHECAVDTNGALDCWGAQVPNDIHMPDEDEFVETSAGADFDCALREDGQLACWGGGEACKPPGGEFTDITVGDSHACALDKTGDLLCWGDNRDRQAPRQTAGEYTDVDAGPSQTCAVETDGDIRCWGNDADHDPRYSNDSVYVSVTVGAHHHCGLAEDGHVDCWQDDNSQGGGTMPPTGVEFTQISAGAEYTCGLTISDSVDCWGENTTEVPSDETDYKDVDAGPVHTCALQYNGRTDCWEVGGRGGDTENRD